MNYWIDGVVDRYLRRKEILETVYGITDERTKDIYIKIGQVYKEQGNKLKEEEYYRKAGM